MVVRNPDSTKRNFIFFQNRITKFIVIKPDKLVQWKRPQSKQMFE